MTEPISQLPQGLLRSAIVRSLVALLMVCTIWTAMLLPLLVLLFYLSTSHLRRQPIFVLNVAAIVLGLGGGVLGIKFCITGILEPASLSIGEPAAYLSILFLVPIYMDSILAVRLLSVYPLRTTSRPLLISIFAPILVLKFARTANILTFLVKYAEATAAHGFLNIYPHAQAYLEQASWPKAEWILQIVDNCYTSGFFLWKLCIVRRVEKQSSGRVGTNGGPDVDKSSRIKTLLYLAHASFIIPCIFSIVQVGIFFNGKFFVNTCVLVTNAYLEIICVLLATLWVAKERFVAEHPLQCEPKLSTLRFKDISKSTTEDCEGLEMTDDDAANADEQVSGCRYKMRDVADESQ